MAHAQTGDDDSIFGINVTPFVDIMLVLLIVFMVATRMDVPSSVSVELPRASTATETQISTLSIILTQDGLLRLNGKTATPSDIESAARGASEEAQAVVSADKGVAYDRVVAVVDAVRRGGVHKLALSTELEDTK
jgi:biopolymer transport protein ExbD